MDLELEDAANLFKTIIQKNLKASIWRFGFKDYTGLGNKTSTYNLFNSIETKITPTLGKTVIEISMIEYGRYVDLGRLKGKKMVPINVLIQWIKARKLRGRDKKTGQFITNEQFAWGIRTNIKKFGIRPNGQQGKGFIDMSINQLLADKKLDQFILDYGENFLDAQLDKIFKQ